MAIQRTTAAGEDTPPPFLTKKEWRSVVVAMLLSPRQAQVVALVMHSQSDKEIAAALGISKRTVRDHLTECKARLNATDRVGMACRVFEAFRKVCV